MPICAQTLVRGAFADAILPDPDWLPSEWANEHGQIYTGSEKGQYRTSRVPPLVEPMNRLHRSDPIQVVAMMKGSRLGVTTGALMWVGSEIHKSSGPIMLSEPTEDVAGRVSKTKLSPMLRRIPVLRARVAVPRAKDTSNTILYKEYEGSSITLVGMNSGNPLREADALDLIMDEVDAYPGEIFGEGDPCRLLERRTATFGARAKIFKFSTPKIKDHSRIEKDFKRGDQRRYLLPCPACGKKDILTWDGVDRVTARPGVHHRIGWKDDQAKTAAMVCSGCGEWIEEQWKPWMLDLANGACWEATREAEDPDVTSYHLSTLYSPWEKWSKLVTYWLTIQNDPPELMVFVNTIFGETWEDRSQDVGADDLKNRREDFPAEVPYGVGILVASVDVQKDRLEVLVMGYGDREEGWVVAWTVFLGDTAQDEVWWDLDVYLKRRFEHESGRKLAIERVAIDSNYATDQVYRFCRPREKRMLGGWTQRINAVRGGNANDVGKPVVATRPRRMRPSGVLVYTLCTHTAKDTIYQRLRIPKPENPDVASPGYTHFRVEIDDEFFDQLMGETKDRKTGRYRKTRNRNEALDLNIYALAAVKIGGEQLRNEIPRRVAKWAKPVDKAERDTTETPRKKRPIPAPRRRGWVSSLR